ncbi:Tab2/Atab2 family RNA-binding protein [Kamptonema formosum]|uniref:Tab2/Atab2 family RNA-binding protein n=1 Tax=Kamptonema formosum TaxID=331992 RepID=UPI00034C8F73|nr:Tab2/Atab2 family RNA-binding protein [Oscillatoria sp. PCC 10802]
MRVWQADFYRRPLKDEAAGQLWELLICDSTGTFRYSALCPQSQANPGWLATQLQQAAGAAFPPQAEGAGSQNLPDAIQVFRPQSLSLIEAAGKRLDVPVQPQRRTGTLKQWLRQRAQDYQSMSEYTGESYDPLAIDRAPPVPLPEKLWGERWRFATLKAGEIEGAFAGRPIPVLEMPDSLLPLNLGLASAVPVPGVVIDGGRQSMRLARWQQDVRPAALNYIAGAPDGLVLEAGLADRWVVATFEDREVAAAAASYEQRKQLSQGLHFLLVQPDESGMTYSGFWLLCED